jgi:replicative DNA helicase
MRTRITQAASTVARWPLFVQDGSLSIQQLLAKARLLMRQEKVQLLIVDYVQVVLANAKDERERLTRISNALRELAKSEGIPVLAISQLNRPKDGGLNARPNKLSLKESGSLENDAHTVLLVYRPVDKQDQYTGEDLLILAKQRHGPVGIEPVLFRSETFTFHEREL